MKELSQRLRRADEGKDRDWSADEELDRVWPLYVRTGDLLAKNSHSSTSVGNSAIFALILVLAVLIGSVGGPRSSANASASVPGTGNVWEGLKRFVKTNAAVRLEDNFGSGLTAWTGPGVSDWSVANGFLRPGSLRLWNQSTQLTDYRFEFTSAIEKKAVGFAYRAADTKNYYATKIAFSRPGPLPKADLIRFAVISGKEMDRSRVAVPLQLRPDEPFDVRVQVSGTQFSTLINGHMVDTWTDSRLSMGGVGFFSEKGEQASVRHVTVTARDDMMGRVLAYFGFWTSMPFVLELPPIE